ncbi:MAG: MotA/TolQ/ExbB proton channel family protein [Spirochaetota bacterium]
MSILAIALIIYFFSFFFIFPHRLTYKENEQISLEQRVFWLSHIASLATLLGLLGTVLGIRESFEVMRLRGQASPEIFAGGISKALSTTIFGLSIAFPSLLFHHLFRNKWEVLLNEFFQTKANKTTPTEE